MSSRALNPVLAANARRPGSRGSRAAPGSPLAADFPPPFPQRFRLTTHNPPAINPNPAA